MRKKFGFLALLALVSFFAILLPHGALAAIPDPCADGQDDKDFAQQVAASAQARQTAAQKTNALYPIAAASTQCVQNLIALIQELPTMGPSSIGQAIVNAIVGKVASEVQSACSQVVGSITSAQTALTSFSNICIPMPSFNGLDLPQFPQSTCSGETQYQLLGNFSSPVQTQPTVSGFFTK